MFLVCSGQPGAVDCPALTLGGEPFIIITMDVAAVHNSCARVRIFSIQDANTALCTLREFIPTVLLRFAPPDLRFVVGRKDVSTAMAIIALLRGAASYDHWWLFIRERSCIVYVVTSTFH